MTSITGAVRRVPLSSWEVGAELLDVLSTGLYSDAKDALREYVQNGVDARAKRITVTIDGPSLIIHDDGEGMDEESIRAVRRFGLSQKNPRESVGYRGIGVYSAFGICDEMTIRSRKVGMQNLEGWVFSFREMREVLAADKTGEKRQGIGLSDLLTQYTGRTTEEYAGDASDDSFTVVRLVGIENEFRAQLNDPSEVRDYLLNTIPVAFQNSGYGNTVNEWLSEHVGLNPVGITLRVGDSPELDLQPETVDEVYEPRHEWLMDARDEPTAFVWYALSQAGRQLRPASGSGFVEKVKGFTLGRREETLKPIWPAVGGRTLYHHYTGEVHILDAAGVFPNAARDDLEAGLSKQALDKTLEGYFQKLSHQARVLQATARAEKLAAGLNKVLLDLAARQEDTEADQFRIASDSIRFLDDLTKAEDELKRQLPTSRSRSGFALSYLTDDQQSRVGFAQRMLAGAKQEMGNVARRAESRTRRSRPARAQIPSAAPPRQVTILQSAKEALVAQIGASDRDDLGGAATELEAAAAANSISRAVEVLDDLKASGVLLSDEVESARKELRTLLGWSALGPVSLNEALLDAGVNTETEREQRLVQAVDKGLLEGFGGRRGVEYESALRAIALVVAEEFSA